ncbi:MAG: cob(I)yrinic acid a,c-diamide adenosyltransferase [Chloroflexota bacterium]
MARERKSTRGLVVVNTGDGKGKTTAALGLAVRAAGNGLKVLIIQFIKGRWKTGESQSLPLLAPNVQLVRMGMGFTIERLRDPRIPMEEHEEAAKQAFERAREVVLADEYDMIVLDEILGSIKAGLVSLDDVLGLIRDKPERLHLVLTGRGAPPELVDAADLVTEMRLVKHPYQQGIAAQRGIEF